MKYRLSGIMSNTSGSGLKYRLASIMSNTGGSDQMIIVVMVIIFCCIVSLMGGYGRYILMLPVEGDKCKIKDDENAEGIVVEKGECKFVRCKNTYATDTIGKCVLDQSGEDCQGSITNAIYKTNVSNVCEFNNCIIGYQLNDDGTTCVLDQSGEDCTPEGTLDPNGIYKTNVSGECTDVNLVSVNCVGEFRDYTEACGYGCGTGEENTRTTLRYEIDTYAENGGLECPHNEFDMKYEQCPNMEACTVIDSDEIISGVQYKVKYYNHGRGWFGDSNQETYIEVKNDGMYNYMSVSWEGVDKGINAEFTDGIANTGNDNHLYLIGDQILGWKHDPSDHYYRRYVVKRSVEETTPKTCVLNREIAQKMQERHADNVTGGYYSGPNMVNDNCAHECGVSTGACESTSKTCYYKEAGTVGTDPNTFYSKFEHEYTLSEACEYLTNAELADYPTELKGPRRLYGTCMKWEDSCAPFTP